VGEGFTFTAANPKRRIDAVFVDPSITVRSATVLDGPHVAVGSDHRPVLVELAF
jgi:endonuclease/exonuclease/phosphatase family metal-dependent hydrolase